MIDYITKIIPNRWGAFVVSIAIVAFLLGILETLSYNSLGGSLLSCAFCYVLLAIVIVRQCKIIIGISTLAAIGLLVLATIVGAGLIIFIEANIYSVLIPYDHPLKHNRFLEWFLPCFGIGLINILAVYIRSMRAKQPK